MSIYLLIFLCFSVMFLLNMIRCRKYNLSVPKAGIITVLVGIMGLIGTRLLYFIENGSLDGRSFFGAVLFFPILLLPIVYIANIKLVDLLDYSCPPGIAMLAIFKLNCYIADCCGGIVIKYTEMGVPVYLPIQIFESVSALIIMFILLWIEYKAVAKGKIYPICLILYGIIRFILNWFRWDKTVFVLGMPAGNFWASVAIIVGIAWLIIAKKRNNLSNVILKKN